MTLEHEVRSKTRVSVSEPVSEALSGLHWDAIGDRHRSLPPKVDLLCFKRLKATSRVTRFLSLFFTFPPWRVTFIIRSEDRWRCGVALPTTGGLLSAKEKSPNPTIGCVPCAAWVSSPIANPIHEIRSNNVTHKRHERVMNIWSTLCKSTRLEDKLLPSDTKHFAAGINHQLSCSQQPPVDRQSIKLNDVKKRRNRNGYRIRYSSVWWAWKSAIFGSHCGGISPNPWI